MAKDIVIQITAERWMLRELEKIARKRHVRYSKKHNRDIPNVAAAGREAIREYIKKYS